jgi:hypothetical protein
VQPLGSFPAFYGTRKFITVFTRALHLYLSCARPIRSTTYVIHIYIKHIDKYLSKFQISLVIISVTVQLWTKVFWVIQAYSNIRKTLPKSGTFLLGHHVCIYIYIYIYMVSDSKRGT